MTTAGPETERSLPFSDSLPNRFFSLGIDMKGRRCLVVGAGSVGSRKIAKLIDAEAEVTAVSPEASASVREWAAAKRLRWEERCYREADLDGRFLVVAATPDASLNAAIGREAAARGILCCVASSAEQSTAIFPAVVNGDSVNVAVHTDGLDCRRAKRIRDLIGKLLHCPGLWPTYDQSEADNAGKGSGVFSGSRKNGSNS